MDIEFHPNLDDFLLRTTPFLEAHEVEHGLMLGLMFRAQQQRQAGQDAPIHLLSITNQDRLIGVAMQTPPHNLILSRMPEEAVAPLVQFVREHQMTFSGIVGPNHLVEQFVARWTEPTEIGLEQMIYRLDGVTEQAWPSGSCHQATLEDLDLVGHWFMEFAIAANLPPQEQYGLEKAREKAKLRIENETIFLWKDAGQIVSMAGTAGPTRNGMRINAVYTPPEFRGRGYASANVAAISQKMLDSGREFCFLYTDAANPISNKIYQNIGYRFVCNSIMYGIVGAKA